MAEVAKEVNWAVKAPDLRRFATDRALATAVYRCLCASCMRPVSSGEKIDRVEAKELLAKLDLPADTVGRDKLAEVLEGDWWIDFGPPSGDSAGTG